MSPDQSFPGERKIGETDPSPEAQARAIADKYLRGIAVEEHDNYQNPKRVEALCRADFAIRRKVATNDVVDTLDTIRKLSILDPAELQSLAENIEGIYSHVSSKFDNFIKELPELVQVAIIKISFEEGPYSLQSILQRLIKEGDVTQKRFGEIAGARAKHYIEIVRKQIADVGSDASAQEKHVPSFAAKESFKEPDNIRKLAIEMVLSTVYPRLMNSPEVLLSRDISEISWENRRVPKIIIPIIERFKDITGDSSLDIFLNEENIADGALLYNIDPNGWGGAERILEKIRDLLKRHLAEMLEKKE